MDDPSKYIIVRSKDSELIARFPAASTGKSVLAQLIKKTGSDGTLMQVHGLDVAGDEDEKLQPGDYIFTPSAPGGPIEPLKPVVQEIVDQVTSKLEGSKAGEMLQSMFEMMQEDRKEKLEPVSISISKITSDMWLTVQCKAKLEYKVVEELPAIAPKETVPTFQWNDYTERAQSERYLRHLNDNINIDSRVNGWVDAAKHGNLLSFNGMDTLGFNFKGTTDVMVATRAAIRCRTPEARVLLLFELKKEITRQALYQAQASLLLANFHSPETQPAMVLTDLRDEWHLLWMDQNTINHHSFISRAEAVGFLEDFLARRIEASEGVHPSVARVAKRRKLEGQLAAARNPAGGAAFEEQLESLEGLLDPSEIRQMRAEFLLRQFVDSPFAPSWRPAPEGMYA